MDTTVERVARQRHDDRAYHDYARAVDRLLAEHRVEVEARYVDVAMPTGDGRAPRPHATFVMEHGTGTPVVFVNGTPATSAVWIPLLSRLRGVRAILVDRPGHGLSSGLDYAGIADIRPHAVGFLEALLDALGLDQPVLAGNSLGGLWCLLLAHDRPARVSAVVLPGLPPGLLRPDTPLIFGVLSLPWLSRIIRRIDPARSSSTRRMFAMMGDPPGQLSQAFVDAYTQGQRLPNVVGGTVHLIHHVRFPGRLPASLWLDRDALSAISQPVLVLAGPDDFLGDLDAARRMVAPMPRSSVVEVGTGHLPWLQDPGSAAAATERFLDDVAEQASR